MIKRFLLFEDCFLHFFYAPLSKMCLSKQYKLSMKISSKDINLFLIFNFSHLNEYTYSSDKVLESSRYHIRLITLL